MSLIVFCWTESVQHKTGVSSIATIDSIGPQPRFYQLYDVGTAPFSGSFVDCSDTAAMIEAAYCEVRTVRVVVTVRGHVPAIQVVP